MVNRTKWLRVYHDAVCCQHSLYHCCPFCAILQWTVYVKYYSCITYNYCIFTATYCSSSLTNRLRLYNPYGSTATQGGMLQICLSNRWRAVCDYSFSCSTHGKIACRQLGFSGSQISKFKLLFHGII